MLKRTDKSSSAKKSSKRDYFEDGATWEHDVHRGIRSSRNRAWVVTAISSVFTLLSLVALISLMPLKQYQPYVLTVDNATGYIEVARDLLPGDLSQDDAVTQANLVQYIIKRETYDPPSNESNYADIVLFSEATALAEYQAVWTRNNPQNPAKIYGLNGRVKIQVKSVNFLNDNTASIRFRRTENRGTVERDTHYVAIISFRYVSKPAKMKDRFVNPLGFQVSGYRVDQEVLVE